mgnify:CR=1 FL=1
MHCVTGKIIELYMEGELPMAKVGVHGAFLRVPYGLGIKEAFT